MGGSKDAEVTPGEGRACVAAGVGSPCPVRGCNLSLFLQISRFFFIESILPLVFRLVGFVCGDYEPTEVRHREDLCV